MKKIRHILYFGTALLIAGCSSDENLSDGTLSGNGKTPLVIEASLSTGNATTRAAGKDFEKDDVLLAYLRHTTGAKTGNPLAYPVTDADQAPKLVSFTLNKNISETANYAVSGTTDLTTASPLYWDDFSNSASEATDLRTSGHGLQSYYGYCYNGGTPTSAVDATPESLKNGTLTWTVGNQTTAEAVQHADLLWSAEQEAVTYGHASTQAGAHGTLTIPYTHAMSEITVTVTCSEGFSGSTNPLSATVLTLNAMNTVTTFTAPSQTFSSGTPATVQMFGETYTSGSLTRNYTAIVAPGTKLKEGVKLLDITNVEDNNYTLTITSSMLTATAWGEDHTAYTNDGNYILTKPGVNYHLTVTVKKTEIQTKATLADWKTVNASGTGDIQYPDNENDENLVMDDGDVSGITGVQVVAIDKNKFKAGTETEDPASFSLFTLKSETAYNEATARTNDRYIYATVSSFKDNAGDANDEWENNPKIYWPNKTDKYYFRALARFNSSTNGVNDIQSVGTFDTNKGTAVSQGTVAEGKDILWGTTAKHKGNSTNKTYERGQAIPPRTGDVPIAFEHAMSKVTFQLETVSATDPNAQVDLTDATIAVTNLYTSGTITIENGEITVTDANMNSEITNLAAAAIPTHTAPISELITIPQAITNNAKVIVTLKDGTTYKLQLNQCINSDSNDNPKPAIGAWERGKHYTYTIHLEKEQITFRALIKDWEGVTGSGNANLEWD